MDFDVLPSIEHNVDSSTNDVSNNNADFDRNVEDVQQEFMVGDNNKFMQ